MGFGLLAKEGRKDAINCDAARVDGQMLKNDSVEAQTGTGTGTGTGTRRSLGQVPAQALASPTTSAKGTWN